MLQYSFTDPNPLEGNSYYRLRQTDFDGQQEAFDLVAVYFEAKEVLSRKVEIQTVAPNPFDQSLFVDFDLTIAGPVELQLLHTDGTRVFSTTIRGYVGSNRYEYIDRKGMYPGSDILRLVQMNSRSTFRLLKR